MGKEKSTTMMAGWRKQYKTTINQKLGTGNECKGEGYIDV
jgi:hypothetical protein